MYRTDAANNLANMFQDRDPLLGVPGTVVDAAWLNELQEELVNLVTAPGIVLAKGTRTQLLAALKRVCGGNVTNVAFADSPKALTQAHTGLVLIDASAGNVVVNLPAVNVLAGASYLLIRTDTSGNTVTVNRAGTDTFSDGTTSQALTLVGPRLSIASDGVGKWMFLSDTIFDSAAMLPPTRLHSVLPVQYRNLVIKNNTGTPLSKMDITADELDIEGWRFAAVNKTADITAAGANGLDTGAEAANTWYHIWGIANISNPAAPVVATLFSTSSTAPTMPAGYTLKVYLGAIYNSSTDFISIEQHDRWVSRKLLQVLGSGTASTPTAIGLVTGVPTTARAVVGTFGAGAGANAANFNFLSATNNSYSLALAVLEFWCGVAPNYNAFVLPLCVAQTIYYYSSASGTVVLDCFITGWSY